MCTRDGNRKHTSLLTTMFSLVTSLYFGCILKFSDQWKRKVLGHNDDYD